jgi:hypothetical protein
MSTMQNSLAQIESMLASLVGGRVTKKMGPIEFVQYAHAEIAKAMTEAPELSTRRLKALHSSVTVFKDNYSSDDGVDVPIFVNDVTAMDDKSSKLTPITAAADSNPDGQSAFEQGFVAKFAELKTQFEALLKTVPDDEDEDEEKRKAAPADDEAAPDSEDEAKRKGAGKPPFPPKNPFAPKKPDPEDDEKKPAAAKGADVSKDGTAWPADLNDPAFVKGGKVEKSLDWGQDPS